MAKIGLIQVEIVPGSTMEERHEMLYNLAEATLKEGADLVFLPEAFQYVFCREIASAEHPQRLLEVSAMWRERMSALAKQYHAYVVPWDYLYEDGKLYNYSYILDRNGEEVGRYKKSNITHSEIEIRGLTPGHEYPVFDLDIGRVAIMICFDNYFPEVAAIYGMQGAELVLYPLFGDTLKPQWELKMRARAADHSMFVASCQIDKKFDIAYTGMVDKNGEVIAKIEKPNSYMVVDVDLHKRVVTQTTGRPEFKEDIWDYLHKTRNYASYTPVTQGGEPAKSWEEIFFGKVPD